MLPGRGCPDEAGGVGEVFGTKSRWFCHERVLTAAELECDPSSQPLNRLDFNSEVHLFILEASGLYQLLVCREALIKEKLALHSPRGRLAVLGRLGLEL